MAEPVDAFIFNRSVVRPGEQSAAAFRCTGRNGEVMDLGGHLVVGFSMGVGGCEGNNGGGCTHARHESLLGLGGSAAASGPPERALLARLAASPDFADRVSCEAIRPGC